MGMSLSAIAQEQSLNAGEYFGDLKARQIIYTKLHFFVVINSF